MFGLQDRLLASWRAETARDAGDAVEPGPVEQRAAETRVPTGHGAPTDERRGGAAGSTPRVGTGPGWHSWGWLTRRSAGARPVRRALRER